MVWFFINMWFVFLFCIKRASFIKHNNWTIFLTNWLNMKLLHWCIKFHCIFFVRCPLWRSPRKYDCFDTSISLLALFICEISAPRNLYIRAKTFPTRNNFLVGDAEAPTRFLGLCTTESVVWSLFGTTTSTIHLAWYRSLAH